MLAKERRAADLGVVPAEELVRQRERPEFADIRVIEATDEAPRAHLRVGEDFGDVVHRPDRHLHRIELRDELGAGERRDALA